MMDMDNMQYAACLRMVRRISGMLYHPEAHKVFFELPEVNLQKLVYLQIKLAEICKLTKDDLKAYGVAGGRDLDVIENDRGKFEFVEKSEEDVQRHTPQAFV